MRAYSVGPNATGAGNCPFLTRRAMWAREYVIPKLRRSCRLNSGGNAGSGGSGSVGFDGGWLAGCAVEA